MKIQIEIPEEFVTDYTNNKFTDYFSRVLSDIQYNCLCCGRYERETTQMLGNAFAYSEIIIH